MEKELIEQTKNLIETLQGCVDREYDTLLEQLGFVRGERKEEILFDYIFNDCNNFVEELWKEDEEDESVRLIYCPCSHRAIAHILDTLKITLNADQYNAIINSGSIPTPIVTGIRFNEWGYLEFICDEDKEDMDDDLSWERIECPWEFAGRIVEFMNSND